MSTDIVSQCRRSFMGSAFDPWPARIKNTEPCLQVWDKRGDPILPPYNKTVSHERTGIGPTEGGPNNGPEYPRREGERKRKRERESTPRCVCNKRRDTRVPSLSPSFLPSSPLPPPPSPPFSSRRREQREHRAWMEEQCTPYINIVPITRSPGGYRSSKTPANFGRRTAPTREALSSGFRFSTPLLLRPLSNEKARTKRWPASVIYGGSRPNFEMVSFPRDYSLSAVLEISIFAREKFRQILIRNGVETDNKELE